MNLQSHDVLNRWVEWLSYLGDNTFTELFTQKILDKECLKQYILRNKSGFLKHNYILWGNTVQ